MRRVSDVGKLRDVGSAQELVAVVARRSQPTNAPLVEGWRRLGIRAELLCPPDAYRLLGAGDIAVVRLDVTPTLDGVEAGLAEMAALERRGVRVVNRPGAVLTAHDKLRAARQFAATGIPHPHTLHRTTLHEVRMLEPPFVLKPRFGSWGQDVMLCRDRSEVEESLAAIAPRSWFRRHGVLIQELVPPLGYDTRIVVAGGRVVGAGRRESALGEWRTNVALGGQFISSPPSEEEQALAVDAARAIGAELVGVDLLPEPAHGSVVLEVNAAVDFSEDEESLAGRSVYADMAAALGLGRPQPVAAFRRLVAPWIQEMGSRLAVDSSAPLDATPELAAVRSWLAPAQVSVRYPGVWLSDRIWATHGHYLNRDLLPAWAVGIAHGHLGRLPEEAARPVDYEPAGGRSLRSAHEAISGALPEPLAGAADRLGVLARAATMAKAS
jgi:[lysine-biosynthesis-protein LysW]---L-2-aminoadipate ligase